MATAYSLRSSNAILLCPMDLSFDLDEALTTFTITSESDISTYSSDENIQETETNTELVVFNLPTAAIDGVCSVCMEDFQRAFPGKQVPCGHVFHTQCITTWIALCNSCPLCRSPCIISRQES